MSQVRLRTVALQRPVVAFSIAAFCACVLGTVAACKDESTNAELAAAVRCAEISFSLAAERRDKDAFARLLDPDARFVSEVVTSGSDAVAESWSVFFDPAGPEIAWRPQIIEVL